MATGVSESLEDFDFELPEELIAQVPASPRDSSRLLVVHRKSGQLEHRHFSELPSFLDAQDLLVANNSKVLKARLLGQRLSPEGVLGGRVEFVMLERLGPNIWEGLFHASAKYVPGFRFEIPTPDGKGLRGVLLKGVADSPHGTVVAEFEREPEESGAGELPLPKYIKRRPEAGDQATYQTHYAKESGSAAAPTAGLHFTPEVLAAVTARGARWQEATLHVGLGTFRPVKDPDLSRHKMHEERYWLSDATARSVNEAKSNGNRILAVGTTSVRTLESAWHNGAVLSGAGRTSLFIRPGHFEFHVVDRLLTNFHLPRSTLLMLVSAFAGSELVRKAYREAVKERYRFFSYGDAMLVLD